MSEIEVICDICLDCGRPITPGTEVFVEMPPAGYGYSTGKLICPLCAHEADASAAGSRGQDE